MPSISSSPSTAMLEPWVEMGSVVIVSGRRSSLVPDAMAIPRSPPPRDPSRDSRSVLCRSCAGSSRRGGGQSPAWQAASSIVGPGLAGGGRLLVVEVEELRDHLPLAVDLDQRVVVGVVGTRR